MRVLGLEHHIEKAFFTAIMMYAYVDLARDVVLAINCSSILFLERNYCLKDGYLVSTVENNIRTSQPYIYGLCLKSTGQSTE